MRSLFGMTAIVLVVVLIGVVSSALLENEGVRDEKGSRADYPMIFAIVATGIITFFGTLMHQLKEVDKHEITESSLRVAIAVSLTTTYIVFVGYTAYYDAGELSELARTAVTSFTTIVGIVIAFFFGSSAYLQARSSGSPGPGPATGPTTTNVPPTQN